MSEREVSAVKIEAIVRQRVLETVNLAFHVCRKQGKFLLDKGRSTENQHPLFVEKERIDSVVDDQGESAVDSRSNDIM
jgi:hypothetical protein